MDPLRGFVGSAESRARVSADPTKSRSASFPRIGAAAAIRELPRR
ncbi:hypothetical protein ACFPN7_14835 [Amycolatopsis halotolerans]